MIPPCPVCKSEIDLDPHETLHVYEGDGGVIVRENGNVSTFGVQSPEVMTAFNAATALLPDDVKGLVERLDADVRAHEVTGNGGMKRVENMREATSLIQSQAASIAELEAGSLYVVWSHEHSCWWRANSQGYARRVEDAGLYSREEAISISHRGRDGWHPDEMPDELPVRVRDLPKFAQDALLNKEGRG